MIKRSLLIVLSLFLINGYSQEDTTKDRNCDLSGYFSGMPSLIWVKLNDPITGESMDSTAWQLILHNRLNLDWYPNEHITGSLQFRNQIISGDFIESGNYSNGFEKENYFLPLTMYQTLGDKYLLSLSIDRAWLMYTYNELEIVVGRQRINWGQTFVWNSNDIFNSYNFFDFDYPEKPGADGIRIQYYPSYTSSFDLAAKLDSSGNITAGALYHFSKWNTDFQILGGYFNKANRIGIADTLQAIEWEDEDLVGGLGFSGALGSLSIRGEMSYFYSLQEKNDSTDKFLGSLAVDYSFSNQAYLMFEFFYNSRIGIGEIDLMNFYSGAQNVKTLTMTKYNAFGQIAYPVNPLLNVNLAGMYFWDDNLSGVFAGPSADLSLGDNLTLSAFFQLFAFKFKIAAIEDEWITTGLGFLRLKWNF